MDASRLESIAVFAGLDPADREVIARLASEVSVPAGKELVREGDFSYDILVVEEGTAEVDRHGVHVADIGPGDVIGEMGVLEKEQRNATVRATSSMMLITLDRWDVKKLAKQAPAAVEHLRHIVDERRAGRG